jgi:demethylmenaquinone methyltransferase/2-methoxy-6-polyprenyl-1,4-benzoquinol methylase
MSKEIKNSNNQVPLQGLGVNFTKVKPYNQEEEKTVQLARMFNKISGRYDVFNDIMSWGMARVWRRKALKTLMPYNPQIILDIATGTADVCIKAFEYLCPKFIKGIDISEQMMEVGRQKIANAGLSQKIELEIQDCATLSFPDASYDAATIAFGIRNFEKLDQSLQQIHRVLKKGGHLLILEMNEPQSGILFQGYKLYTNIFVRLTTHFLSSDKKAYTYLTTSMHAFPQGKALIEILLSNGFTLKVYKKFTFGVCSMYLMQK